jgi:hypothetical protein
MSAELAIPASHSNIIPVRSDSLGSNGSGLARRPRIRSRTRTLPEGECWSDTPGVGTQNFSDTLGGPHESRVTGGQLVAETVSSEPPPRPPRSPRRSMFIPENDALDIPNAVARERKTSATSTRSVPSTRGANASLEELLALKNVRKFLHPA